MLSGEKTCRRGSRYRTSHELVSISRVGCRRRRSSTSLAHGFYPFSPAKVQAIQKTCCRLWGCKSGGCVTPIARRSRCPPQVRVDNYCKRRIGSREGTVEALVNLCPKKWEKSSLCPRISSRRRASESRAIWCSAVHKGVAK